MKYGYNAANGKISINSIAAFCDGMGGRDPLTISSFEEVLKDCEALVRSEFTPKDEAINNVRGNWYEWLLSLGFISFLMQNGFCRPRFFLPLPNVTGFDVYELYRPEVYAFIADLRRKTQARNVSLITSNPDYAIIDYDPALPLPTRLTVTPEFIGEVDTMYRRYIGACDFSQIHGFASIKTSLRPDRRLQLAHEGALTKAFYEHLKGRLWEVDAPGLKYYGCSMEVGPADLKALRTVATHSILSVNSVPEPAVDALFRVSNGPELTSVLRTILL